MLTIDMKEALNQFSTLSFNHIIVGSSLSISCLFPVEGIYCTHKSLIYNTYCTHSCIDYAHSQKLFFYTVPIYAQVEHPDFMPFENAKSDERSAPISPTSQTWIQECAEQDLRGLLCDTFRSQQEWMITAEKVLYHPETMPEVSVTC